ncbi:MAG: SPOR domain-containing protein [bacterium]
MRSVFLTLFGCILFGFVSALPSTGLAPEYRDLKTQIQDGQALDTGLVENLPEPSEAEEYWLRSFTRVKLPEALADVEMALRESPRNPSDYLLTWLNLALLDDPSKNRLRTLREFLSESRSEVTDKVWLRAGKYAGALGKFGVARTWTRRILDNPEVRYEALLDLSQYCLKASDMTQADKYLQRYLLERPERTKARYWTLRGKYFRKTNSDSEAYLAYSHLVRNYPGDLQLYEAEEKLRQLSLPGAFKPNNENRVTTVTSNSRTFGQTDRGSIGSDTPQGDWAIQVGSFQSRERAERYKRRLEARHQGEFVIRSTQLEGVMYHRVKIAGFETEEDARRRKEQLEQSGIDSFITEGSHQ